jgi:erythromycin esterase-like protein
VWFEAGEDGIAPILEAIGDARVVLIGEASHGTHEFYRTRADLTQTLVTRKGFNLIAAEADWPRCLPREPLGSRRLDRHRPEFDLVLHLDRTRALQPLERWAREETDAPETYPTGV